MHNSAFRFDDVRVRPDRQIGMNSHPEWELSYVISGVGRRIIGGRAEDILPGEVVLIPPGIPHVWEFDPEVTDPDGCIANISIFFEDSTLESLAAILPEISAPIRRIRELSQAISYSGETLRRIVATLMEMRSKRSQARLPHMLTLLTIIADTDNSRVVGRNVTLNRSEQRLEKIRTFCACNYARNIPLAEVAAYAGMNKSAFCTFMKRHTGTTFSDYMNSHRLKIALDRLRHTDDNISDIAYSVGFSNVSYFNRLFKSKYSRTPASLRTPSHL